MAERAIAPAGFDVQGAARDIDERARRYAPIYAHPDLADVVRLLHRNPAIASQVRPAVEAAIAALPEGERRTLADPLFGGEARP